MLHQQRLNDAYTLAKKRLDRELAKSKENFDRRAHPNQLKCGDLVLLRKHPSGRSKMQDHYFPDVYQVVEHQDSSSSVYTIQLADGSGPRRVVNSLELKLIPRLPKSFNTANPPTSTDSEESESDSDCQLSIGVVLPNTPTVENHGSTSSLITPRRRRLPEVPPRVLRRSERTTKGQHSNPFKEPRSVLSGKTL